MNDSSFSSGPLPGASSSAEIAGVVETPAPAAHAQGATGDGGARVGSNGGKPVSKSGMTPAALRARSAPRPGAVLTGRVAVINDGQVFLDVGLKYQAVMPCAGFDDGTAPGVGTEVEVVVEEFDVSTDLLHVHRKGVLVAPLDAAVSTMAPGMVVEGRVSGMNKGGLEVQLGSVRAFMPASQVAARPLKDISVLLGQTIRCEVLEVDTEKNKLVVSRRAVVKKELADARRSLLDDLEVGQLRKGRVSNLADFGAFVDLGGVHGLLHVSDMSWTPVENPADIVKPGDEVEVKVLKVNRDRKRVSLGLKQAKPDPWSNVPQRFPVGTKLNVGIVRLADYGAFAEVADGVHGLIPLSEMSWTMRPANVQQVLQLGQRADVVVIGVDAKRRRISLSIKQTCEDPWSDVAAAFPKGSIVTGTVSKLLDFGALVAVKEGVEGMIHVSELSDRRVSTPADVVKVGDEVSVKVLSVDVKKRRVSLSIKATKEPARESRDAARDTRPRVSPAKRKKTLRGGLASHFKW